MQIENPEKTNREQERERNIKIRLFKRAKEYTGMMIWWRGSQLERRRKLTGDGGIDISRR